MKRKKNPTMHIRDFVSKFETHPILFIGSGMSRRYLENYPDWYNLLREIAMDMWDNESKFLELSDKLNFEPALIATELEASFKQEVNTNPKFSGIKKLFEDKIRERTKISPFKLYLAERFSKLEFKSKMSEEISLFKTLESNIKSIVTTNYDGMIEDLFNFDKLVGNNILLSRQYGSIYKMHGCFSEPNQIIFTNEDYREFTDKNRLIISQLISLFIHSPIVFLGYGSEDENVNFILETIFNFIGNNQRLRDKVKNNYILVDYKEGSTNTKVTGYDKTLPNGVHLSLHKIETDDYKSVYNAIANSAYAVEAGVLRLVDNLMQRAFFYSKNKENSKIVNCFYDDIKSTNPSDLVVGILNKNDISTVQNSIVYKDKLVAFSINDFINNYFDIIEKKKVETIELIESLHSRISCKHYFPIFAFTEIAGVAKLKCSSRLKDIQESKLNSYIPNIKKNDINFDSIKSILDSPEVTKSRKGSEIAYAVWNEDISIKSLKDYLISYTEDKNTTQYRILITLYDYMEYGNTVKSEKEEEEESSLLNS